VDSKGIPFLLSLAILILPSTLKILLLRALGVKIGRRCYIGFSIISCESLIMGRDVYIGHFNLIWRLKHLNIGSGSTITMFNWITGARMGSFFMGANSAITRWHFLESSGDIRLGNNSIIAGRCSHLFTHGISSTNLDDIRSIIIGNWCYVGSSCRFVPGAGTTDYVFVGMGSVVTKKISDDYVLVGGSPAIIRKKLKSTDLYFDRPFLPHAHHSSEYKGE
jgi:acetyltransferase-like isoleucine patch superfamily enzyme